MSGPPVNLSGWLLSVPASLALHAVPLALFLRLFAPAVQDVFVVDLTERPEAAHVQPRPTEVARRPAGPASPRSSAPTRARAEVRPAEQASPAPPLATVVPPSIPRAPDPPPPQPPRDAVATPISPAPPPPAAVSEPMLQVAEPPRQPAPTVDAVFASPPAVPVERDSPAAVGSPASATATEPTPSGASGSTSIPSPPPTVTARVGPGAGDAPQPDVGARIASTSGSGAGHGAEAEYRAYLGLVRQRILEALRYPRAARQQGLVGTVYLEIVVQPTGVISDVKIVSPSSHPVLDQAALETVRNLPSIGFPPGLAPRQLRARLPVMFNLR